MCSETARDLPDFFVAGHPKCGTTALYEMLRQHPDVFMCPIKEPLFFAEDLVRNGPANRGIVPPRFGLPEYRALFAERHDEKRAGEASPLYVVSRLAAERIRDVCPQPKVIALFREPASFLRSLHLQNIQAMSEDVHDLRLALELESTRRAGRRLPATNYRPALLFYSDFVQYADQLARLRRTLGEENILPVIYEDFRESNDAVLHSVADFLEIDAIRISAEANPTVALRSERRRRLVRSITHGQAAPVRAVRRTAQALLPEQLRQAIADGVYQRYVFGAPPQVDEELMGSIRARYRPEVERFSEVLGRDMVQRWGLDRL